MSVTATASPVSKRELVLTRIIDAPREAIYRAWTSSSGLRHCLTRRPLRRWTCAGGASLIVMRSPDGEDISMPGVFLEVVPNERIVFTDAYTKPWEPLS